MEERVLYKRKSPLLGKERGKKNKNKGG